MKLANTNRNFQAIKKKSNNFKKSIGNQSNHSKKQRPLMSKKQRPPKLKK